MTSIAPALIAAAVTVIGWYATYAYTRRREDRTRRLELALRYRERQIQELYGPLVSLIEQVFNVWEVRQVLLESGALSGQSKDRIDSYFATNHFRPLHAEVRQLLRTKVYLFDGGEVPQGVSAYFLHSVQEAAQRDLAEQGVDTSFVAGRPWPSEFYETMKATLDRLMLAYQGNLSVLGVEGTARPAQRPLPNER